MVAASDGDGAPARKRRFPTQGSRLGTLIAGTVAIVIVGLATSALMARAFVTGAAVTLLVATTFFLIGHLAYRFFRGRKDIVRAS